MAGRISGSDPETVFASPLSPRSLTAGFCWKKVEAASCRFI
jgi:hypothetical protein